MIKGTYLPHYQGDPYAAQLNYIIFYSVKAGIAEAIPSFKRIRIVSIYEK